MNNAANKVAQVTFAFWIMKICATTIGSSAPASFEKPSPP